ncbi:MAG: type III-B CRISPR module RAMP protein Cmr4 [bacterium]
MYTLQKPFFMRVISPLHLGTGADIGIIDMPIQREKHTNFPKVESSSLKGALRENFELNLKDQADLIKLTFGPEKGDTHAGAFSVTDATTLFFPVKSAKGIYALITCHEVLAKYNEHCGILNAAEPPFDNKELGSLKDLNEAKCIPFNLDALAINNNKNVILEEYAFEVEQKTAGSIQKHFSFLDTDKMLIVSNETFRDFVTLSTEVITRNKIDNKTGTVARGALFSEEYLPPETILFSLLQNGPINVKDKGSIPEDLENDKKVQEFLINNFPEVFQLGGNATIGKGIVKVLWGGKNE